jgi:multiple sugar transport system substrate-binding protein
MKPRLLINIICLICLFLILGGMTGCQAPAQGEPGGDAPAVISVWYTFSGNAEQELLKQFERINKEHPEVLVKGEKVPATKLVDQAWYLQAGGEGPEIFIADRSIIFDLYEKGIISPVLADNYPAYPAAKTIFTFNQQEFAAPWLTDVPLLYYRQDKIQTPPVSFGDLLGKKVPVAVKALNTALLSPWWLAEGGSLTSAGIPVLDSQANSAFLNTLLSLRSAGILLSDNQALEKFMQGDVNYLWSWASDASTLNQAGVAWGSVPLNSLFPTKGKVLLAKTVGIANSSIKTVPVLENSIRLVQEELLKTEAQAALAEAGGYLPGSDIYYQGSKPGSFKAAIESSLKTAWPLEGYLLDWKLLTLQDRAWQNISGGAKIEGELAKTQQEAQEIAKNP